MNNECFWKKIQPWEGIDEKKFGDYRWQLSNTINSVKKLRNLLKSIKDVDWICKEIGLGLTKTGMELKLTPYIFSLIDWDEAHNDPIRRQFIPFNSDFKNNHPFVSADSLSEIEDSPYKNIIHRYKSKILMLVSNSCYSNCTFCTRPRIVYNENSIDNNFENTIEFFLEYLNTNFEIEDLVISGGDAINLFSNAKLVDFLKIMAAHPKIQRVRIGTRTISVFPMLYMKNTNFMNTIYEIDKLFKSNCKHFALHTQFNHPNEITFYTKDIMKVLFSQNITVRNQSVLLKGVNDDVEVMYDLLHNLTHLNIQPYYVYLHDMVPNCEHLRTTLKKGVMMEKKLRGRLSGFSMPTFVCDLPQGGGKRDIHSYEEYNINMGVSRWNSYIKGYKKSYFYFDPIQGLSNTSQKKWNSLIERKAIFSANDSEINTIFKFKQKG